MNRLKWIVIGALLCLFSEAGAAGKDWVKYVNTGIGGIEGHPA